MTGGASAEGPNQGGTVQVFEKSLDEPHEPRRDRGRRSDASSCRAGGADRGVRPVGG